MTPPALGLGLGLPRAYRVGSVVAPTPLWSMDPATVYDDVGNPADPGDPVSRVDNPQVTGNDTSDLVQTTALLQPTALPLVGGEGYLYFPGVNANNASFLAETLDFSSSWFFEVELLSNNFGVSEVSLVGALSSSPSIYVTAGSQISVTAGGFSDGVNWSRISAIIPNGVNTVVRVEWDGVDTIEAFVDGVSQGTDTLSAPVNMNLTHVGCRSSNAATLSAVSRFNLNDQVVIDFTAPSIAHGATSFTCDTGQTVTINQSGDVPAQIIRRNVVAFDTSVNDERLEFTWPLATGNYWFCSATDDGIFYGEVKFTNGSTYDISSLGISRTNDWLSGNLTYLGFFDLTITQAEKDLIIAEASALSNDPDWSESVGAFNLFIRNSPSLVRVDSTVPAITGENYFYFADNAEVLEAPLVDVSAATRLQGSFQDNPKITSVNTIGTPDNVGVFTGCFAGCTSLADFPANWFDTWNPSSIASSGFSRTWENCNLSAQSVENILVSLDASGKYATNNGTSGGTALTDSSIDIDSDGSSLTSAASTAIANLKAKGWGIILNGIAQ